MGRWWQLAIAAAAGLAIGILSVSLLGLGGGQRIGMVDLDRVLRESEPGKSYQKKLDERTAEIKADLAKITNPQEKAAKSELAGRELAALQQQYTKQVIDQADPVIARLAKRRGLQAVFVKGLAGLRYARTDLTADVIKELDK